jgi:4-hydroxy-tetrahydrodipicolinate reductase
VIFLGEDETVEFTHRASSRRIFAAGAIRTARAICGMPKGEYTVDDILFRD